MEPRTTEEIANIDKQLSVSPIDAALELWCRLRSAGGMPAMTPEHFREVAFAIYAARKPMPQSDQQ